MVYNENLVAVVKCNGRVVREHRDNRDDIVFIPFGFEYSIVLKNLNTVKALVRVEIDGREVISGLIINPNSNVELERFFEGNMNSGHKFKFIEKTDDIKNFRGDKVEDGIIRIEYQFEKQIDYMYNLWHYQKYSDSTWPSQRNFFGSSGTLSSNMNQTNNTTLYNYSTNDEGITAEGSQSQQSFVYADIGTLDHKKHCINIMLKGYHTDKKPVKEPITVKTKIQCQYCGRKHKSNNKFCPNCGSALI